MGHRVGHITWLHHLVCSLQYLVAAAGTDLVTTHPRWQALTCASLKEGTMDSQPIPVSQAKLCQLRPRQPRVFHLCCLPCVHLCVWCPNCHEQNCFPPYLRGGGECGVVAYSRSHGGLWLWPWLIVNGERGCARAPPRCCVRPTGRQRPVPQFSRALLPTRLRPAKVLYGK